MNAAVDPPYMVMGGGSVRGAVYHVELIDAAGNVHATIKKTRRIRRKDGEACSGSAAVKEIPEGVKSC